MEEQGMDATFGGSVDTGRPTPNLKVTQLGTSGKTLYIAHQARCVLEVDFPM